MVGGVTRTSKWPVFRLLNKNVTFYQAALCGDFLTFSLVQDTWCEPSWLDDRLLLPEDDKKGHFLEFSASCSAASRSGWLLNGLIHSAFAVAQCCSLKCICSRDVRLRDAEDGNVLFGPGLCEHQPAGYIVLSQRSKAAVSSLRNNHILATPTGRLFFTRPSG